MISVNFIILHYKTNVITERCIDSILQQEEFDDTKIIVIDNASGNDSGELLKKKYFNNSEVKILDIKTSRGFSYANNLGYKYCKEHYNPDLFVISNNDVIFKQKDFLRKLRKCYLTAQFHILGPDIVDFKRNIHLNPTGQDVPNLEQAEKFLKIIQRKLRYPRIALFHENAMTLWRDFKRNVNKVFKIRPQDQRFKVRKENVCLWGACLVFSKEYGEKRDLPFFPETYFYHEEQILFYQAKKMHMKVMYEPELQVVHEHGTATKVAFLNELERKKFQWKNNYDGTQIYIEMLKQEMNIESK